MVTVAAGAFERHAVLQVITGLFTAIPEMNVAETHGAPSDARSLRVRNGMIRMRVDEHSPHELNFGELLPRRRAQRSNKIEQFS